MSGQADARDLLYVRGLLAEAGVEETPELVEALLALRSESSREAPEPTGPLGALLAGTPVPLTRKSKRSRGIILSAALLGTMAAGATGVAANPDFLIRADPVPSVSFTPEDLPTAERTDAPVPVDAAAPDDAAAAVPLPADVVPAPVVDAPPAAADQAAAAEGQPAPAPAPAVAPAAPKAPGGPGKAVQPKPVNPGQGPGTAAVPGPPTGYIPGQNRRADGSVRDTMGPGNGAGINGWEQPGNGQNGRGNSNQGKSGGPGSHHDGWPPGLR